MDVQLPLDLEQFIQEKVASGQYVGASEVLREGLLLLRERDLDRERHLNELRQKIAVGIEQADRGETSPLDMQGLLAESNPGPITPAACEI